MTRENGKPVRIEKSLVFGRDSNCYILCVSGEGLRALRAIQERFTWDIVWTEQGESVGLSPDEREIINSLLVSLGRPIMCTDLLEQIRVIIAEEIAKIVIPECPDCPDVIVNNTPTNDGGSCQMCCCNNSPSQPDWQNTLPQIPSAPPEPSPEVRQDNWCKICIAFTEVLERDLAKMKQLNWLIIGFFALATLFEGPIGWFFTATAVASVYAALEASGGAQVFLSGAYLRYLSSGKEALKCELYNASEHSAQGAKTAYYRWVNNFYDETLESAEHLLFTALGMLRKWNGLYGLDVSDIVGTCTECGEGQPPPTVPESYEIVPTQVFFDTITSGDHAFTHSEPLPNKVTIGADLVANEFLFAWFLAKGPQSLDASNGYMGAMIKLVSLSKSATPTDTTRIREHPATLNDVGVGILKQGQGVARLYTLDDPTAESDLAPWLSSQGYRVTIDDTLGRDNEELNPPDRGDGLLPLSWSDKVNAGGQAGRLTGTIEVYLIRVKL